MIKLKDLLMENEEEFPEDSNLWDSWVDYIEYFEYEIEKVELGKLVKKYNLHYKTYFNNKIIRLYENENEMYLEYDKENETASLIRDIEDWASSLDPIDIDFDEGNLYNGHASCTLSELCENPGMVYHYTTEEKWEQIQEDGRMKGSYGTGINNRSAHGIFTSIDPEEYVMGTYGNVCLSIDLEAFKNGNNLSKLQLEFEPEVIEYLFKEYVYHTLELNTESYCPSDISPNTVIVNHTIPIQYIKNI